MITEIIFFAISGKRPRSANDNKSSGARILALSRVNSKPFKSDTITVKKGISIFLQLLFILLVSCLSVEGWAEGESTGSQAGILFGYSVPDAQNSNPHRLFGVKGSASFSPNLRMGGYYYVSGTEVGTAAVKFDYSLHGIEGILRLADGSYLGLRAGITKVRTAPSGKNVIFSPYHYGAAIGYDYALTSWVSMGYEGSFVYVEKSNTTSGGTYYSQEDFSVLSFLITLQFRL